MESNISYNGFSDSGDAESTPLVSFIATSTNSSSPSMDFATTFASPEESASEPVVSTMSEATLSETLVSVGSSSWRSEKVVNVAIFSRTFRLMISRSRA